MNNETNEPSMREILLYFWWNETGRDICLKDSACPPQIVRAVDFNLQSWKEENNSLIKTQFLFIEMLKNMTGE